MTWRLLAPNTMKAIEVLPLMFRFSIRDVIWLMVVVAIAVGWLVDHTRTLPAARASERYASLAVLAQLENAHCHKVLDTVCPNWQSRYPFDISAEEMDRVNRQVRDSALRPTSVLP
jgi:hypothetical protein